LQNYRRVFGLAGDDEGYDTIFSAQTKAVGSPISLIIMCLTAIIPLLAWVLMGYFATLPSEVERAARLDGCSRLKMLWHMMLPMAAPGISAAFIIAFLFAWNEFLFAIFLTGGGKWQTLSPALIGVSPIGVLGITPMVVFAAASTLSVTPPVIMALMFQRYITRLNIVDPVTVRD